MGLKYSKYECKNSFYDINFNREEEVLTIKNKTIKNKTIKNKTIKNKTIKNKNNKK